MDRINDKSVYRKRRVSLTFRKIKLDPCTCKFTFFCDSQGYDPATMKKNNPLIEKKDKNEEKDSKFVALKNKEEEKLIE